MRRAGTRPLESLGISASEEQLYRWLVKHRGATASEAARALSFSPAKTQRLLISIQDKGLATHTPERSRRYIAAAPDMALGTLILQHQRDLHDAGRVMQEIQEEASASRSDGDEHVVEMITSVESERRILRQINATAENEIITLTRPPLRVDRLEGPLADYHREQRQAQNRGVVYRNIVDVDFLAMPKAVELLRSDIKSGENIRVASNLPLKMVAADRRVAFVPLNVSIPRGPSLLVRASALLDALYTTFELLWKAASPVSLLEADKLGAGNAGGWRDERVTGLISLMASGLNDKKIAYDLGVTSRTLRRHVADLMQTLNARTRFQLGWLAALRLVAEGGIPDVGLETKE